MSTSSDASGEGKSLPIIIRDGATSIASKRITLYRNTIDGTQKVHESMLGVVRVVSQRKPGKYQ